MQKKSLLVALFCGALCLVGCIKNEESASVAQVRIAKANELNSIADLNKAKAAAEAVYAQAELVVAQAEAKLREANAALVLAQAETEKVRAELLKVKVQLREVEVEEQKVELQRKQAELEVYLAQYEAQIAKAEADKQAMINVLNDLIAKAEIQSIRNAKALIAAQDDLENYLLTQERVKADSAKAYSRRYFAATDEIQKLQFQQIKAKAQKALVEAGALEVRDAIYAAIDDIDAQIEENEALIAILKERQYMTPEEAKVAVAEAKLAMEDAYTEKAFADSVKKYTQEYSEKVENKTVEFVNKDKSWYNAFKKGVQDVYDDLPEPVAQYVSKQADEVKVGEVTVDVEVSGIKVPSKENDDEFEFIPLWRNEATKVTTERYPDITVYSSTDEFVELNTTAIAPATIYYDNVKVALDTAIAVQERAADRDLAWRQIILDWSTEDAKENVAEIKNKIELHKKYIAAYKDTVEKYEAAYLDSLALKETYETNENNAWRAFQEYMLLNYPVGVSRKLLIASHEKDSVYQLRYADSLEKNNNLKSAQLPLASKLEAVETNFEAMAKAEGKYRTAIAKQGTGGSAHDEWSALEDAIDEWDPEFAAASGDPKPYKITSSDTVWYKGTSYADAVAKAGKSQNETLNATAQLAKADSLLYEAQINYWRGQLDEEGFNEVKAAYNRADHRLNGEGGTTSVVKGAIEKESEAQDAYLAAKEAYEGAMGSEYIAALKAWNPAFNWKDVISFPTETRSKDWRVVTGYFYDGKWHDANGDVAASAQENLIVAVKAVMEQYAAIDTAQAAYNTADQAAKDAKGELDTANSNLLNAIKTGAGDPAKLAEAEKLYEKWVIAHMKKAGVKAAWDKLFAVYCSFNPDVIGMVNPQTGVRPADDQYVWNQQSSTQEFSWLYSKYHVDYMATVLGEDGEPRYIAEIMFPNGISNSDLARMDYVPEGITIGMGFGAKTLDVRKSYQYKAEDAQNNIDVVYPGYFAQDKARIEGNLKTFKENMTKILNNVNAFKAKETGYKSWITDRENAEKAVNAAKKAAFDANKEYKTAKAIYEAVNYIADGFVYVYVGEGVSGADDEGFKKLNINDAIEHLEGETKGLYGVVKGLYSAANNTINNRRNQQLTDIDLNDITSGVEAVAKVRGLKNINSIAELTFAKELLQNALKYGKVALQYVLEAYDEEIAELDEKMEFWTILAEKYKAIMNIYLGIVDEAVVAEPVEEEGDEE